MSNEPKIRRTRMTMANHSRASIWLAANAEMVAMLSLSEVTDKLNREAGLDHPMVDANTKTLLGACGIQCRADTGVSRQAIYDKMLALQGIVERQGEEIASLKQQLKLLSGEVDLLSDTWAPVVSPSINCHAN